MEKELENLEVQEPTSEEVDDFANVGQVTDGKEKTYSEHDLEERISQVRKEYEDNSQKMFNARWAREKDNIEAEHASLYQMERILQEQLGTSDRNEMVKKLSEYYQVDVPTVQAKVNEKDEKILARADAQEIIGLGDSFVENEANRIASIPFEKRSLREKEVFNVLCKDLTEKKQVRELKEKGAEADIYNSSDFKAFKNKFNSSTPVVDIYDMYTKMTEKKVEKPASAGSVKSTASNNAIKEFYTREEALQFTREDLRRNPKLREKIQESMAKW